jgi:Acetyltransferase (GNAT) domain
MGAVVRSLSHSARWAVRRQPGVLNVELMRPFVASVLPELDAAGLLRLHFLRVAGQAIAAVTVLIQRGSSVERGSTALRESDARNRSGFRGFLLSRVCRFGPEPFTVPCALQKQIRDRLACRGLAGS